MKIIYFKSQTKQILCFFMQYIYAISKNNLSLDDVYSQVACAIDMHKFTDLVEIVEQFVHLYSKHSGQLFGTIFAHKVSCGLREAFEN